MDRQAEVTRFINKTQCGIEVGPWFAPLAPKRNGYNSLSLDIFDADTLRQRALDDPHVPRELIPNIEEVDLIGTSTEIEEIASNAGLTGKIDYVISSHNFEHLPNPIRFLHGCGRILTEGGILSMAIPDKRVCFDHFRPCSVLSQWLEAFFENRVRPTHAQVFDQRTLSAVFVSDSKQHPGFSLTDDTKKLEVAQQLLDQYKEWKEKIKAHNVTYYDTHCSTFTPSSFELMIHDLRYLGLCPFEIVEISGANGNEFYVHLRNRSFASLGENASAHYARRETLLYKTSTELAWNSPYGIALREENRSLNVSLDEVRAHARIISEAGNARASELEGRLHARDAEITLLESKIRDMETRIADFGASTSWRITAPLRALRETLRRRQP